MNCIKRYLRHHKRYAIMLICAFFATSFQAKAQRRFLSDIFTLYTSTDNTNPLGSDDISNSLILLDEMPFLGLGASSNASLIATWRNDDQVCLLTSATSVLAELSNEFNLQATSPLPAEGLGVAFDTDLFMGYRGQDSVGQGANAAHHYVVDGPYPAWHNRLDFGTLVALKLDPNEDVDIALVLADKSILAPAHYQIGYNFQDLINQNSLNYMVHHAEGYPQCISNNLLTGLVTERTIKITNDLPYAFSDESLGAPVIKLPTASLPSRTIRGVYSFGSDGVDFGQGEPNNGEQYFRSGHVTRINVIEDAIRRHCWTQDSSAIAMDGRYKNGKPVLSSDVAGLYLRTFVLNSVPDFTGLPALMNHMVHNTVKHTRLNGIITAGGFVLPTQYPGSTYDWQVTWVGKEVNLNDGFSYTASGNAALNLVGVSGSGISSAQSISNPIRIDVFNHKDSLDQEGLVVYPNPSTNGEYTIVTQLRGQAFRVEVHNAAGQRIHKGEITAGDNIYKLMLGPGPKGSYFLGIYEQDSGARIFSKVLIYE